MVQTYTQVSVTKKFKLYGKLCFEMTIEHINIIVNTFQFKKFIIIVITNFIIATI